MWVRSEYAGELAVLSAWVCALLPWSVSYASRGDLRLFRIHFLYLFFQFVPGVDLGDMPFRFVQQAPSFAGNGTTAVGYRLWLLGAVVLTLALALSFVYYVYDERLEARSPLDPVRLMGGLLVAGAVVFTGATALVSAGFFGVTVPVGVVFMYLLGSVLLFVERT